MICRGFFDLEGKHTSYLAALSKIKSNKQPSLHTRDSTGLAHETLLTLQFLQGLDKINGVGLGGIIIT